MHIPRFTLKHWRLTTVAVVSLSIAVTLVILSLSVANTALLLPPAGPGPDRLVMISGHSAQKDVDQISYPDYKYFRENNRVFTDIAAAPNSVSLLVDTNFANRETRVMARPVSANYFDVIGIRPYLGRFFAPGADEADPHAAVMTYWCWKRLGADPNIVGKRFGSATIIGITPPNFTGAFYGLNGDLLTPLADSGDTSWLTQRGERRFFLLARLKPGVSRRQAQAAMTGLSGQLAAAYPKDDKNRAAIVTRATLLPPDALQTAEIANGILVAIVLLVLLIACVNVANLLLARAVGRRHEAAVKLAMGAPRGRLVREFLRESVILCALSAALGYGMAAAAIARFSEFSIEFPMFGSFSFGLSLRLDSTVLAVTVAIMVIAILATGLAPALYASSPDIAGILSGEIAAGGTGRSVWRNALVTVQVAVCTLVLVGLGLCQRNLYNLRHANMGFTARNLISMSSYFTTAGYTEARGKELYANFRRAVSALPGVESVTLALNLPLEGGSEIPVQVPGGGNKQTVSHTVVDADYFSTLGIALLKGRVFNSADRENTPETVIVNRRMAETFWPGQDPLGKPLLVEQPARRAIVVGVVEDGKYEDLDEPRRPFLYYALSRHYQDGIHVIARTAGDPRLWVEPFRKALSAQDANTWVQPATFENWLNLTMLPQRIIAGVIAGLSGLGLLLAAMGLSGAVSYSVSQRKRELGIRVALGATSRQLVSMVLRQVLLIAGAGIAIGLLLGTGAGIILRSQFYRIGGVEWTVLIPVSALMLAVSLGVAYFSARPWIAADPMQAVRHN